MIKAAALKADLFIVLKVVLKKKYQVHDERHYIRCR